MSSHLTELALVQVLEQASNPQYAGMDMQKIAEKQLKEWEVQPGFHYLLQSIYMDLSVSLQVRWLAIIQFKNGLDSYWRSTRINAISKDEKKQIRNRLFDMIDEPNDKLAIQNAQAVSRVARIDFPVEWPNLFEQIEVLLNNENVWKDQVKVYNILIHLNQIIKIIAVARIGRCRPAMQSKMPIIFPLLMRIYLCYFNKWTNTDSIEDDDISELQVSYLALKVLRRIVVDGFESPHKDKSVIEFMSISEQHFQVLLKNYQAFGSFAIYEKFIKCYCKLYFNLISSSTANFVMMPSSKSILITFTTLVIEKAPDVYRENPDSETGFWESIAIRGFLILKKILNFITKKGAVTIKVRSDKADVDAAIHKLTTEFLSEELIKKLVDLLIDWYLKLRPADLEAWSIDPEEWVNEQMSSSFEYQIRPCAENFFQNLITSFQELLGPYLLSKIDSEASQLTDSIDDLLKKDALFCAFQLSAHAVSETLDFDRLLETVFLPEASKTGASSDQLRVIRRRVALVIDGWVCVSSSDHSKQQCYQFFLHMLKIEPDKVVQLSIVQALRTMIDDWDFKKEIFEPYLESFVTIFLQQLLPEVSLTETRLYVLNTLTDLIIQTKPLVNKQLLMKILEIVPKFWDIASNDPTESILANVLLRLLRYLAISLRNYSYATWDISLNIIETACNPTSSQSSLLLEDGLELWSALLQNYDPQEQNLDERFLNITPLLLHSVETQTELLPISLEILKSYSILLPPQQFHSFPSFNEILKRTSSHLLLLRDDAYTILLEIWDILALADESENEMTILYHFSYNSVFKSVFDAIFLQEQLSPFQTSQLFKIFARISFSHPNNIITLLSDYQKNLESPLENSRLPEAQRKLVTNETPLEDIIKVFFDVWCKAYGSIYDPKLKKIHLLGMSSLLKTGAAPCLSYFAVILSMWIESLEEINENSDGDCEKYHLSDAELSPETNCEQVRLHELIRQNDPAHIISVKNFISETLSFLKNNMDEDSFQKLVLSADPVLMENLQLFMSIKPQ